MRARGYISAIPHIIRQQNDEFMFRLYVTDSLRARGENKYLQKRWAEIIERKPQNTRTADEIILGVIQNAGLKFKGQGGETE